MATPEQQTFAHNGRRLAYEVHGDGPKPLVYMHGLLLDAGLNRAIAVALAERGNRVILLDLLGHGGSEKPRHAAAYRMDLYVEQVIALLDHLDIDQAILGGISLGANVSLLTASTHPERVRALVLEMPVLERATPAVALTFVPILLALHYGGPLPRLACSVIRRLPRTPFDPLNSILGAAGGDPAQVAAVLHGVLLGPVAPTVEQRGAITVPGLVLAHRADFIHPFSDAESLVRQMPNARLLPARSPLELRLRPRRLTAQIEVFLDDAWRPTRLAVSKGRRSSCASPT